MTAPYRKHNKLVKDIAEKLNINKRVVDTVCRHSLHFTANRMRDFNDLRPVRWRYLGILAIIEGKEKRKLVDNDNNDGNKDK